MFLLIEYLQGYGIIRKEVKKRRYVLDSFYKYKTKVEAIKTTQLFCRGKINKNLKKFLKNNIKKKIIVNDIRLKIDINRKLGKSFCKFIPLNKIFKNIKNYFKKKINKHVKYNNDIKLLASHFIYGKKVKFSGSRKDIAIVYAIKILQKIEKKINSCFLKLKEWYNWHFPELLDLVPSENLFVKLVREIEIIQKLKTTDISNITAIQNAIKIKKVGQFSIGYELSQEDLENILYLSDQVISSFNFKEIIKKYLKNRMYIIAPNLTAIAGEKIGARLISHVQSIRNLAKYAASAIQIFGAEKAMFFAKKNKTATPKFGIIYNCKIIAKTLSLKNKGKLCRMISAKIALSVRVDTLVEFKRGGILGIKNNLKLEKKLQQIESFSQKTTIAL